MKCTENTDQIRTCLLPAYVQKTPASTLLIKKGVKGGRKKLAILRHRKPLNGQSKRLSPEI